MSNMSEVTLYESDYFIVDAVRGIKTTEKVGSSFENNYYKVRDCGLNRKHATLYFFSSRSEFLKYYPEPKQDDDEIN